MSSDRKLSTNTTPIIITRTSIANVSMLPSIDRFSAIKVGPNETANRM